MLEVRESKTRVQLRSDSKVKEYDKGELTIHIRTGADKPKHGRVQVLISVYFGHMPVFF